jgi:hypothetical protein
MNSRYLTYYFVSLFLLAVTFPIKAQIQLGGLADFELRKGGSDSSPYVNQTPNNKWTIYTPYIRLFANANISENWYVSSVLQSDYYYGTELNAPFFSVINVNWMPVEDSDFTVTIGRFLTPYGAYSEQILSSDNPFVHLPLTHSSGLPVSPQLGLLSAGVDYDEELPRLTMIYQRMYSQGISIGNTVGESEWLRYDLAATLAPVSAYFETSQYNTPSFTGRLAVHPKVWGRLGFSFSSGPFMFPESVEASLPDADPTSFRQTSFGTDFQVSYHYYTFLIEYNWSRWEAPYIDETGTVTSENMNASVNHISGEAVFNFPFFVGGYAGIRYEQIISGDLSTGSGPYSSGETWTYDRERLEFLLGYKLHRDITLKTSYLYSTDSGPDLDDDVFAMQLSVAF